MTIALETKVVGSTYRHDDKIELIVKDYPEEISLRDLIREKVKAEIRAFNAYQKENFGMEYRSFEDLRMDIRRGEINIKRELIENEEDEIKNAIDGFVNGRYKVFLNGTQISDLDERIPIGMNPKVMFLRLMPLTGG